MDTPFERLKSLVNDAGLAKDMEKATAGNKAAGTRVRKKMQEIKAAAQAVRDQMIEVRKA